LTPRVYTTTTKVEAYELSRSNHGSLHSPTEKIKVIEVENFPMLGKLIALRFIEWVQKNPGGVISLPTGKSPEHFIKWVQRILQRWDTPDIQQLLVTYGIEQTRKPDMGSLSFVQIDEFYPMNSKQHNSFNYYVNELYIKGFGLSPKRALLIDATSLGLPKGSTMEEVFPNNVVDLTLRIRHTQSEHERLQKSVINRVDEFCMEYESKIREMGGIGFFLGGIGPDGHIAFNVRGSSVFSVTRLTGTNYETQAAAATDLGGIEISRNRLVITIGLSTITYNPTCTAIIIAAGEAKANIVADAIQETKSPQYPASVLQDLEHSRFYLTRGAASELSERKFFDFSAKQVYSDEEADEAIINLSLTLKKPLHEMDKEDFVRDRFTALLLKQSDPSTLALATRKRIIQRIERGLQQVSQTRFLHTEPHHDDIMLAYLAHLYHLVRDASNYHYFANLTSGFTSVTNAFVLSTVITLEKYLDEKELMALLKEGYFHP